MTERDRSGRLHLGTVKEPAPEAPSEAIGGSGRAPERPVARAELRERVIAALKTVRDPEIPLNIYDLGLVYDLAVDGDGEVAVTMTLTAPACPVAGFLVQQVADVTGAVEGVRRSRVELVWDPPWSRERMSPEAQLELGLW